MGALKRRVESFYRIEWRAILLEINVTDNSYIDTLSIYIYFYIEFCNGCENAFGSSDCSRRADVPM